MVENHEQLARVIISPYHLDQRTGGPSPAAFDSEDLMHRGLSVLRPSQVTNDQLWSQAKELAKDPAKHVVHCIALGSAEKIRNLLDQFGRRAFCVIDDPQPGQDNHATVMRSSDQDKIEIKKLRKGLMDIFCEHLHPPQPL